VTIDGQHRSIPQDDAPDRRLVCGLSSIIAVR
jgi:hypothetical protein